MGDKTVDFLMGMIYNIKAVAEMAERLNAHDSKSCDAGMYPRVQIPLSAPEKRGLINNSRFSYITNIERDLRVEPFCESKMLC